MVDKRLSDIYNKITVEQEELLKKYLDLLLEANQSFNLTSIKEYEEAFVKHILDSIVGANYLPERAKVLDIGSGGGCPAIPLAIARADITVTMIDSTGKKVNFLNEVIAKLGLTNAKALHQRAEEFAFTDQRESFDIVTARAVASFPILLELAIPFVKKSGNFIAYKSCTPEEYQSSLNAQKVLGAKLEQKIDYILPSDNQQRSLYIFQKEKNTDIKYPRAYAKIAKKTL